MEAGRELDALVAEKVMGWTKYDPEQGDWDGPDDVTYFAIYPNGLAVYYAGSYQPDAWFAPSTDIAAAWQVVEELHSRINPAMRCAYNYVALAALGTYAGWAASFGFGSDREEWWEHDELAAKASTAPHAICLAALKAMEVHGC